ncbi:alpha/beta hydrolase fold protein [Conexibacter woesei DSM 14684]|uniref:Alpha/beta hydrolase fold protein n=1 Tax=Conexibacter woesei (strain DSM 14684 / CCUG 47730 / CIP 108061 / JCM 11494 / NBRC 100937 / ID131577) TaxID=469383 RepID=D3FC36_CONWI|nr:alpha/beta hydrolase fold protein [Conexibacter woesei DSM 14684]
MSPFWVTFDDVLPATSETTSTVTVDGLRLRVAHTRPAGIDRPRVVVVLHGWGASIDAVGSILAGLRDKVELVALDLPGFGESDMVPAAWSNADYARLVLRLADQLGIERFALVGHSRGAAISLVLASDPATSGRIERMVLTGAAGIKPRRRPSYYAKVGMAKAGRVAGAVGGPPGKRVQQKIRARAASADWLAAPEALRGTLRNVLAEDLSPRLPQVDAPTLLIWGPDDEDTPLWMAERMEREIPGAGLVVLRGGGHFAYAERAGEFNVIAAHFLAPPASAPTR